MSSRKERHGKYTGDLGKELKCDVMSICGGRFEVHYDHGKSGSEKIVAHTGERSSRANSLSFIDIAVTEGNRTVLLCEVEEEGARPKKVIGDLCNILLADGLQISGRNYRLDDTRLVIGVRRGEKSKSGDKTDEIVSRIKERMAAKSVSDIVGVYGASHEELKNAVRGEIMTSLGIEPRRSR